MSTAVGNKGRTVLDAKTREIRIGLGSFDLVKGFAIILIIVSHMTSHYDTAVLFSDNVFLKASGFLLYLIGAGINPVFFIISGYSFKGKPVKNYVKKNFSDFIKPYFYVMVAVAILYPIVHGIEYGFGLGTFKQSARWVLAFLFGLHDPAAKQKVIFGVEVRACWVAWFLLTMFHANNIFNLILKLKNTVVQFLLAVFSVVLGYALSLVDFTYFCLPQGFIAVGYCYAGYALKRMRFFEKKRIVQIGICLILFVITLWENLYGDFNLAYNRYKNGLLEILGTCCAGALLLILSLYAGQYEWRALDWIKEIGIYTRWILCIHSVELICLPWDKIVKSMPEHPRRAFVIEMLIKILIYVVGCTVLKRLSHSKYKRKRMKTGK